MNFFCFLNKAPTLALYGEIRKQTFKSCSVFNFATTTVDLYSDWFLWTLYTSTTKKGVYSTLFLSISKKNPLFSNLDILLGNNFIFHTSTRFCDDDREHTMFTRVTIFEFCLIPCAPSHLRGILLRTRISHQKVWACLRTFMNYEGSLRWVRSWKIIILSVTSLICISYASSLLSFFRTKSSKARFAFCDVMKSWSFREKRKAWQIPSHEKFMLRSLIINYFHVLSSEKGYNRRLPFVLSLVSFVRLRFTEHFVLRWFSSLHRMYIKHRRYDTYPYFNVLDSLAIHLFIIIRYHDIRRLWVFLREKISSIDRNRVGESKRESCNP